MENPENSAAVEDSTTLRRQSFPGSVKGRARSSAAAGRWRRISLAVLLLGILAGAVSLAAWFALYSPRFRMESLHLQGGKFVTLTEVEEKFTADKGKSVLRVPLERRRGQIERIPWVHSATVRRALPNQLWVTVRERVPVAFLRRSGGLSLVDEEGVILDCPKDASFRFPVVWGLAEEEPPEARRAKMQLFAALMKDMDRGGLRSNDVISEVDLEDPQDARVVIADLSGAVLLHLGQENFLARYLLYIGHIEEWKQKSPNIQSVDLRYDRQVVINADPPRDLKGMRGKNREQGTGNREQSATAPDRRRPPL